MNMVLLSTFDLVLVALLVLALAVMSNLMALGITRSLIIAALRTVIQLLLIGLLLKFIFSSTNLVLMVAVVTIMLLVAGREVMARQQHRLKGWWGFGVGTSSILVSSFAVTFLALLVVIQADPWYEPRYLLPLLGMILGNSMNGVALGVDRLTHSVITLRGSVEARLILGQTWLQAIEDIRRDSMRTGMMPIINAMAIAGVVSLPGMMTGQILSGIPPLEAVKYQILIMFLIASSTGFGVMTAVHLVSRRLFDQRQRLHLDRLSRVYTNK
ncbi:MAG: iron export ABC transporter permease subunit FetB [Gammaproteobacteria bacterium]|nr:MAG: iron export ABC transporter permease subunit FetB [Gammaproteobacteria bacterium]